MNTKRLLPALIAALGFGAAQATLIFSQNFEVDPAVAGSYGSLTQASGTWVAYRSNRDGNTDVLDYTASTSGAAFVSTSGPLNGSRSGYMDGSAVTNHGNVGNVFVGVTGLSVDLADEPELAFNYSFGNLGGSDSSFTIAMAVQVGETTTWYRQVTNYGGANVANTAVSLQLDTVNWVTWTDPSTGFANATNPPIGGSVISTGTVTAVGFIGGFNRNTAWARIDNVELTVIPEPGTLVLVGIALGSLLLFRRRR